MTDDGGDVPLVKVAEHKINRRKAVIACFIIGIGAGLCNAILDRPEFLWPFPLELLYWVLAAIPTVLILHEGLHGLAALALGHRPVFGVKFPLFFTTFRHKLPRGVLIVVALTPLVVIDGVGMILYLKDILPLFSLICVEVNTIGAVGDCWIVMKLLGHERGTLIQDTMSGIEVWRPGP